MTLYRIYIDEVGNHDLDSADNPNERFLSLTGVILESGYTLNTLIPQMDEFKRHFFQRDPDEPIVFHRKELLNKRSPFQALRMPEVEVEFNQTLLKLLAAWNYTTMTVVIDKREHRDRYQAWQFHPYHYCLRVLLERYVLFLYYRQARGDVMVESRGGREDIKLKDSFSRLHQTGSDHIPLSRWQGCLTSKNLKVKPKRANIAGLQLADLIAHPSRREILIEHNLMEDDRVTFGDQICAIQRESKYYRNQRTGQIEGYGKKLLP